MTSIGGHSRFLAFFDECGDHSLEKMDRDFPRFVLALVVMEQAFYRILARGTPKVTAEPFKRLDCELSFQSKKNNIVGVQVADLCAHPCARHILNPSRTNRAFEIARQHIYADGDASGWKVFP